MKAALHKRKSKREEIIDYFFARIGERLSSAALHARFGTSFRTRVSEINRDAAATIEIHNRPQFDFTRGCEVSLYWATPRGQQVSTKGASGAQKGEAPPGRSACRVPAPHDSQGRLFA